MHGNSLRGLEPVAAGVRDWGMKFGLWFELERSLLLAMVLGASGWFLGYRRTVSSSRNLTLRDTQEAVSRCWLIPSAGSGWSGSDLTAIWGPAPSGTTAHPTGKIQFAFCEGLYRVLDAILLQNLCLVLECCARPADGGLIWVPCGGGTRPGISRNVPTPNIPGICNAGPNTFSRWSVGQLWLTLRT